VLDDAILEAFMYEGYLIIPDGANDGVIADPIWMSRWGIGYAPGANSQENRYGNGGGGGCSAGSALSVLMLAFCAIILQSSYKRGSFDA
jgi:hypothetical protein